MPRTVVYRAGGFTNCGIGYTKFSQEELAERRDRAMTDNEAIEALMLEGGLEITGRPIRVAKFFEGIDVAIKALKEIQKYRKIENDLKENYHANVDIPLLMKHFIETVFKGEKHEGFCILTNEDKEAWDAYCTIGTPEECRAAMEKKTAKKPDYEGDGYSDGHLVYDTWICPCCGKHYEVDYDDYDFCPACGQHIDWSNE